MKKLTRTVLLALSVNPLQAADTGNGVINVATIGEPPTLDPMATTTDLVAMISQHLFETLYTFNAKWEVVPLLAQSLPTVSADGKNYDIPLCANIHFHNGKLMTPADVVASLERWLHIASRGKQVAPFIAAVTAHGEHGVRITLHRPYSPLLSLLAFNNSAAATMPAAQLSSPLTHFIGTGPYRLK
ncbi:hypothetical protein JZM24_13405 [Candidatus Sodalis endolongispinus]|uniref:Solute-binding protein family 5 domain-containing protein n=1 Tax=Candidatus Sodalis endolongispinus TaxID=2812662 RepID=A0ABS5YCX3_9GAMM|nr:hypothetical protein [Candidatus Sodalis endolongispinus]